MFIKIKEDLDIVKKTAYLFSDKYWVSIDSSKDGFLIELEPKENIRIDEKKLRKEFLEKLKEQKLKEKIYNENLKFRNWMIKQAMLYTSQKDLGLTKDEEEELEKLIKEVEEELKKEGASEKRK